MNGMCIYNANIVLPDRVIFGWLTIKNGKIDEVQEGILGEDQFRRLERLDAASMYVLPGIIDIANTQLQDMFCGINAHNPKADSTSPLLAQTIQEPRPPLSLYFSELEKKLALSGITTAYHALPGPDQDCSPLLMNEINRRKAIRHMLNHRAHMQFDLSNEDDFFSMLDLIKSRSVQLVSFMRDETLEVVERPIRRRSARKQPDASHLVKHAQASNVGMALYTDELLVMPGDCLNPVNYVLLTKGVNLSSDDLFVCIPLSKAMSHVTDSQNQYFGVMARTILYSADITGTCIPTLFRLANSDTRLPAIVATATLNPAKALGIDRYLGSIEPGKIADLVIVEQYENAPLVKETLLNGRRVISCNYFE